MKFIRSIFVFILSFLITFIILDLYISSTHIVDKSLNDVYPDIGRGRLANKSYVMFTEGFSMGQFNQFRYLGPGYPKQKPKNTLRIALLGDSFVEGFQVFDRDHFRKILEDELSKKLNQKVEILNFGRSGFDIGDMYAYNQTLVKEFNPDLSLYFISNADLTPQFTDPLRLKVYLQDDSLAVAANYPLNYIKTYNQTKILIQNSAIINMLNIGRRTIKEKKLLPILLDKFYPKSSNNEHLCNEQILSFHLPEITKNIINNCNPAKDIIINRDSEPIENEIFINIQKNSISFFNLYDTLNILKQNNIDPYYWKSTKKNGHWNHQAHIAVGTYLAEKIYSLQKENPEYQYN